MLDVAAGQIVADKYRIDELVGSGGMGVVVAATHIDLGQKVAIKLLRDVSEDSLARFKREARLIVRLRSEHVARVFDVGALEDDTPYIVMELLEGSDLATVISSRERVSVEEATDWVLEAIEAIAEAHALGMVHRDLKPANLFLARGPGGVASVKVLDFGVSKVVDKELGVEASLTGSGTALGSPGYMSPEQMTDAREVDVRSDIWSLGAILYRLVGGRLPYRGESIVAVLAAMTIESLVPLPTLVGAIPVEFDRVVARCLAVDKATRYANLAELAIALLPFASSRGKISVERVCATLSVTFHADGTTTIPTGIAAPRVPHTPRAAGDNETTAVLPHAVAPHLVFPQTPSAPMLAAPPAGDPSRQDMPRALLVGISSAVLAVMAGAIVWLLLTPSGKRPPEEAQPVASASAPAPQPVAPPADPTPTQTLLGVAGGAPPAPPSPPALEGIDAPPQPQPPTPHRAPAIRRPTAATAAAATKPAPQVTPDKPAAPTTTAPPASRH